MPKVARVLILGTALCQGLGFLTAFMIARTTLLPSLALVGLLLGFLFTGACLFGGYYFHMASGEKEAVARRKFLGTEAITGESGLSRLLRDFREALLVISESSESESCSASAATEVVSHLLNNGMTPESVLARKLEDFGWNRSSLKEALRFLEEGGYVTVRANGVSLVQAKRRLFM